MHIKYFGHSCFQLKGKKATVVLDPFDKKVGLRVPKFQHADILCISHDHYDHNNREAVENEDVYVIQGPGEYEVKEVFVKGFPVFHDKKKGDERGENTVYKIDVEGVRICHVGDLGHKLSEDLVEEIGDVDILMLPVGGKYTIDAKEAFELANEIEPEILIPMHYKVGKSTVDIEPLDKFLEVAGQKELEPVKKLKVKEGDFGGEEERAMKIVVMEMS